MSLFRRDLLVGGVASLVTALVLVPVTWASCRSPGEQAGDEQSRAQRALLEQAAQVAGFGDESKTEVLRVTTAAVAPEIPQDAWLLIDKQTTTYAVGDIVVIQEDGLNYLGRVAKIDETAGRLTLSRNGEQDRIVAQTKVLGRGVLNTR